MRRLRRIILNVLTVLSLVLCLATAALWIHSYFAPVQLLSSDHTYVLNSLQGRIFLIHSQGRTEYVPDARDMDELRRDALYIHQWHGGFERFTENFYRHNERTVTAVPYWFALCAAAALPLAVFSRAAIHRRRRRTSSVGLCPVCSYDLRATPDRCPECGTVPVKALT